MNDQPPYPYAPGHTPAPLPQPRPPIARVFTTLRAPDGKGGQYFDVPLAPMAQYPGMTPWAAFMTNLLVHRGLLLDNFWLPERVIDIILVNPDSAGLDPNKVDVGKIVPLRPVT